MLQIESKLYVFCALVYSCYEVSMRVFTLLVAVLLSLFATVVMSYISMATAIGPWVETTVVLLGMLIFYGAHRWYTTEQKTKALGLVSAAGGIGGILSIAVGFTFPTLYFLDPEGFTALMKTPWQFAGSIGLSTLAAGAFGLLIAQYFEKSLIDQQELAFPIGDLVYKMIVAADNFKKAVMLACGFVGTQVYLILQAFISYIPNPLILLNTHSFGALTIPRIGILTDQLPMFWAIGFVTGHVIAIPLFVGMLSKILVIDPLHYFYPALYSFFYHHGFGGLTGIAYVPKDLSLMDFTIAFTSGLVLYGACKGFLGLPKVLRNTYNKLFDRQEAGGEREDLPFPWYLAGAVVLLNIIVLSYLQFAWTAQIYLLLFTLVCTYQLMFIAGKFGLAPLGRFATFVMVPYMLIFGYTPLQTTLVALYVEVAGGVACDALFGRKMARLASIDKSTINRYQWLGLLVSSFAIGAVLWIFINHFGLGTELGQLAVTRAAGRALLISVKSFDIGALLFGALFAYILSYFRISAALLLGGILMPISYTLMLVGGGLSTYLVQDKEEYYPFWSGVFASNSLWMLLRAFI